MQQVLTRIAVSAGREVLSIPRSALGTEEKGSFDLLTVADKRSQEVIAEALMRHFPGVPIVGEEDREHKIPGRTFFTIDPIDGTAQFVQGGDQWGVTIGFIDDGVPQAGVIHQPRLNQMLYAEKGRGASLNGVPLQFSPPPKLNRSIIGAEIGWWLGQELITEMVIPVMERCLGIRSVLCSTGSIVELCTGKTNAYLNPKGPKIWDLVAGTVAITEAGGIVVSPQGNPVSWDTIPISAYFVQGQTLLEEILTVVNLSKD